LLAKYSKKTKDKSDNDQSYKEFMNNARKEIWEERG
jgi:hypothetical protein